MNNTAYIALFRAAREVIKADEACRLQQLSVSVWPVPESLSSECGMCLHIEAEQKTAFEELMSALHLNPTLIPYEK